MRGVTEYLVTYKKGAVKRLPLRWSFFLPFATRRRRSPDSGPTRQLQVLNEQLYRLFLSNSAVQEALHLPIPVVVVGAAQQQGGVVHAQRGRMVSVMAEPGERVFPGPLSSRTLAAAETLNRQFPRFQVGGFVDGDSLPLALPSGSFVLTRNASRRLRGGLQTGGPASGGGGCQVINHFTSNIKAEIRNDRDIPKLAYEIERHLRRISRSDFDRL